MNTVTRGDGIMTREEAIAATGSFRDAGTPRPVIRWVPYVEGQPCSPGFGGELNECDCGQLHPNGWICNSPHRDQL